MGTDVINNANHGAGAAQAYLFTLTRSDGFDLPEYVATVGDFGCYVRSHLPDSWSLNMFGLWYQAIPPNNNLPPAGFKLHISSTMANARRTIDAVTPVCTRHQCRFKVLRAENFLSLANSKGFAREAAHKFITIYPVDLEQFRILAEALRTACAGLTGPRVLSDRPVGDSQAVFYRYGGFRPLERLQVSGHRQLVIPGPGGQVVPDQRRPYFVLPEGVDDPFECATGNATGTQPKLNGRYRITEALSFSTCGGIYLGLDELTDTEVVVKEARPLTRLSRSLAIPFSRTESLQREARVLELLDGVDGLPQLLDTFEEGGHFFVVQSRVEGQKLREFRASDHILLWPFERSVDTAPFEEFFESFAHNLIRSIQAVHQRRIILGDVSSGNVLVTEEGRVSLIDFESAWAMSWGDRPDDFASTWMTPGHRRPGRGALEPSSYRDDWFSAGMILLGLLLPVERQIAFNAGAAKSFLKAISRATGLGAWVGQCMQELWKGRPGRAIRALKQHHHESGVPLQQSAHVDDRPAEAQAPWIDALPRIRSDLRNQFDESRTDRLWPCDFEAFLTSPLNLGYGAGGPVMALCDSADAFPEPIREVLAGTMPDVKRCAPGLLNGLAGIALWKFLHVDRRQGCELMATALDSTLARKEPGFFQGMSGIGFACLQLFHRTNDAQFLGAAADIGRTLEQQAIETDGQLHWPRAAGETPETGLAHGASGIALFLLHLSQVPGQGAFEPLARAALEQDLGRSSPAYPADRPRWTYPGKDTLWSPYWLEGGSGIGAVVARFYHFLRDQRYREIARNIADANYTRFTVMPGQFEGVAGIGEFMLDLAMLCDMPEYRVRAERIARSILLYGVEREAGLAFPGRHLIKLSCCHGYGSAGIAMFFDRLESGRGRFLHDLV